MKNDLPQLPVAVVGAGPIGLAAAAHLARRGFAPVVLEAGASIASAYESFRHVQLFSPWRYNVDAVAREMLEATGWVMPPEDELPTAGAMIDRYLAPLAQLPAIAPALRLRHRVTAISRKGFDKVKSAGRDAAPFVIRCATPEGEREIEAWAVLDASGTWGTPNPMGANGLPALGEREHAARIAYGMPDILGRERARYAGKHVLVVGSGHSAAGSLLALAKLAESAPGTRLAWAIRGHNFARIFGGGAADGLPARGALGTRLKTLADSGRLELFTDFRVGAIRVDDEGRLVVEREKLVSDTGAEAPVSDTRFTDPRVPRVDEIIVATGGRPDLSIASELRVKLDPWIESTEALAPLIDPNVHSCGTVRPHGHRELAHPESRFYAVGAKSYGRAPNFLVATGHEQVRSVVAALAGDLAAADEVRLELPETGVCSTQFDEASSGCCTTGEAAPVAVPMATPAKRAAIPVAASACCGGPPVARADACCAKDEEIKDAGDSAGCGSAASRKKSRAQA